MNKTEEKSVTQERIDDRADDIAQEMLSDSIDQQLLCDAIESSNDDDMQGTVDALNNHDSGQLMMEMHKMISNHISEYAKYIAREENSKYENDLNDMRIESTIDRLNDVDVRHYRSDI